MNEQVPDKKYKSNNKVQVPKLDDKNKSTSKSLLSQDDLNLLPTSSRKVNMSFLEKYLLMENEKEDKRITAENFKTITIDELINCILVLLTLGSCFIYNETKICAEDCFYDEDLRNQVIDLALILCSITTLLFILMLIIKYYHYFHLYKSAKYIQPYTSFFEARLFRYFIIEFIFAILHPNLLFKNKYFTTNEKFNFKKVDYNVNDIFLLIQCFRLIYLIIIFAILSDFYSPRADRICKMMGKKLNLFFSFRALFVNSTSMMLVYCSIIICSMLSYILKIISQPIIDNDNSIKFHNFGNCIWYTIITMTTVGYGDIYPETTLERIVGCIIASLGNVVVALIVSFFQDKLNLGIEEKHALDFIQRINEKEEVMKASAGYFKANMSYIINKRKMENGLMLQNKKNIKKLVNLVKEKIEARKLFKNLFHKFHIHFKMETEVDKIKKKIDSLDYVEIDLSNYINIINIKIKELIRNINGFSNNINNNEKKTFSDNNNDEIKNSIIHEIENVETESDKK